MSPPPPWKQDVFVSSGEDVKKNTFISNLFKRLHQVGIGHFGDKREGAGKNNEAEQLRQLSFAFALVVFSENYVNSNSCINELVNILCCQKKPKLVVIPIFYMDRANVSNLASNDEFQKVLESKEKKERDDAQEKWSALAKAGYELKAAKGEENLIDKIVGRLVDEIHSRYSGEDFTFGPFGGAGQNNWESKKTGGKAIKVEYGDSIKSISFKVRDGIGTVPQHGKDGGYLTYKVKLEDGEYITSFAGSKNANNKGKIDSLTFRTNKRILGPIGREKEKPEEFFSIPSDAGEVTKFFWRNDGNFIGSIGACVKLPSKKFRPVKSEKPFGQEIGLQWDDGNQHTNVKKIIIQLDPGVERVIRSIEFHYVEKDEMKTHPEERGVPDMLHEINIDGPDEYLTSISGWYTNAGITSLTFLTNKKRLTRTIGDENGTHFSSPETYGKIVGFYGWSESNHLRGIGAYFEPISDLYPVKSIGPFGGGNVWDDGKFDGVKKIYLHFLGHIRYIMFEYDDGSELGRTIMHNHGTERLPNAEHEVRLKYPREYLTSISGYTRDDGSIQSLTFYTNRKICSFGKSKDGKYFGYPSTGNRIIGFYGTWGKTLNSIGVYVKPIPHLYPFEIVRPFPGFGGIEWDDGVYTGVRGFRASEHDSNISATNKIESITFKYDNNGSSVEGDRHGSRRDAGTWEMLDYPKERLTSVVGRRGEEDGQTIIYDLEIHTNANKHPRAYARRGDQEKEKPEKFFIPGEKENGRIVGFFGTAGERHLNFIGARLEPY